jgi:chromosome partitioning protein
MLGTVDPETFAVSDARHYAKWFRTCAAVEGIDRWVVMRNRLSMVGTRNKPSASPAGAVQRLEFRTVEGFAERMIFRSFIPAG